MILSYFLHSKEPTFSLNFCNICIQQQAFKKLRLLDKTIDKIWKHRILLKMGQVGAVSIWHSENLYIYHEISLIFKIQIISESLFSSATKDWLI